MKKYGVGKKSTPAKPLEDMANLVQEYMPSRFFTVTPPSSDDQAYQQFLDIPPFEMGTQLSPVSLSPQGSTQFLDEESDSEEDASPPSRVAIGHALFYNETKEKPAADFLAAMSDDETAFTLYSHLSTAVSMRDESTSASKELLLTYCYRTAGRADNIQAASHGLSQLRSQLPESDKDFIFSVLDARLQDSGGMADKGTIQGWIWDLLKQVLSDADPPSNISRSYYAIDVVAYRCLIYALKVCNERLSLNGLSYDQIHDKYVLQQLQGLGDGDYSMIRSCIQWCQDELASPSISIPAEVASLTAPSLYQPWCDNVQVFCALCDAIFPAIIAGSSKPDWYDKSEAALGISGFDLLATVCWMIGEYVAPGNDALERARTKAESVAKVDNNELWINFLKQFVKMQKTVEPLEEENEFGATVLRHIRRYVSKALNIQLPIPGQDYNAGLDAFGPLTPSHDFDDFGWDSFAGYN